LVSHATFAAMRNFPAVFPDMPIWHSGNAALFTLSEPARTTIDGITGEANSAALPRKWNRR
jgi:hypothetical protein